jgi:hypothetical protein
MTTRDNPACQFADDSAAVERVANDENPNASPTINRQRRFMEWLP